MTSPESRFSKIYEENYNFLYDCALHMAHDNPLLIDEIPNVLQDVFLLLWKNFELLSMHPNLPGWLILSTRLMMKNARRGLRTRTRHEATSIDEEDSAVKLDIEHAHIYEQTQLAHAALNAQIDRIVTSIGEEDMHLLLRYHDPNANVDELASEWGISPAALRKRVSRAYKKIRLALHVLTIVLIALTYGSK